MNNILCKIRDFGFIPDLILDIGCHNGSWSQECLKIFPNSKYNLFDATEYELVIELNKNIIRYIELLSDIENKEIDWYCNNSTGDSVFKELTPYYENIEPVKRVSKTIDGLLSVNNEKILIKIDCQGSEIPILKGSENIIKNTEFVILEIPFFGKYNENTPTFLEHIKYMDDIGFIPFDIIENHIIQNFNIQVDIIFIKKTHYLNKLVQDMLMKK